MRKPAVIVAAVAVAVLLAGTAVVVFPIASHRGSSGSVDAQHGGSVEVQGASLSAPPGSVSGPGRLTASTVGAPAVSGAPAAGLVLAGSSVPVLFQVAGAQVTGPLTITFHVGAVAIPQDVPAADGANAVWLAFYDPGEQVWQPVVSRYDAAAGTVTAQVSHLSWWAPWTWDWQGMSLRLHQLLSGLGGGRAPASICPGVPQVIVTNAGGNDPPLIGCATSKTQDAVTVSITNNRGLSVVMSGVPPDATIQDKPSYQGFDEYLATRDDTTRILGGTDLPPAETLTYSLPLHGPMAVFSATPTLGSYMLDLAVLVSESVLNEKGYDKLSDAYLTCTLDAVARDKPATIADAETLVDNCLPALAKAVPALKSLDDPRITLLLLDVRFVLQDTDLINDELIRKISGSVKVARPASTSALFDRIAGQWAGGYRTLTIGKTGRVTEEIFISCDHYADACLGSGSHPQIISITIEFAPTQGSPATGNVTKVTPADIPRAQISDTISEVGDTITLSVNKQYTLLYMSDYPVTPFCRSPEGESFSYC